MPFQLGINSIKLSLKAVEKKFFTQNFRSNFYRYSYLLYVFLSLIIKSDEFTFTFLAQFLRLVYQIIIDKSVVVF